MRKIKEILRLREAGLSVRQIARSLNVARSSVAEYERRAATAGMGWPLAADLDETTIEQRLFPSSVPALRPLPNWAEVHVELRRKGMTLALLWEEYKGGTLDGYHYSRYCDLYRAWVGRLDLSMRQEHKAGEKMFVDYVGPTVPVTDGGTVREAQIFVAVLGASNYTYAEATWTQALPDWIGSHVRAFEYFQGTTEIIVPDNLKSGVAKPCRYEPEINATYEDLLAHYGTVAIPARVRKPKDKSKAENGVLLVERWILARLRHRTFLSLAELNAAIRELLIFLNGRPFKKLPGSRRSMYETLDRPALRALPSERYNYAEWKRVRINVDYHVAIDEHRYSVPYQLFGRELDVRTTAATVECFYKGRRVASHVRSRLRYKFTTVTGHMPPAHQGFAEWTPERIVAWTAQSGPSTRAVAETIIASRVHPQQAFRSCLGLLRLGKTYSPERLEAACARALHYQAISYTSVKSILKMHLDQEPLRPGQAAEPMPDHPNIRGAAYYEAEHTC
ncbi:MAG: IS21 family transposase [Alphaproteobacteria bacterium]